MTIAIVPADGGSDGWSRQVDQDDDQSTRHSNIVRAVLSVLGLIEAISLFPASVRQGGRFVGAVATDSAAERIVRCTVVVGLCASITAIAHAPLLVVHLGHLWARPHFQFVSLLLPLTGWLMWQRWPRGQVYVPIRGLERVLLGGSIGMLGAGVWLNSPYLAAVSANLAIGFLILHAVGAKGMGALLGPWTLLWFAVPPPLGYDLMLVSSMQSLTSRLASLVLDLLCIDHLMSGNVLQVRQTSFFVDEACSGVHSLFALLGYTAVFLVIASRGVRRSVLLLVSSVGWALLANVLRVSVIAVADVWWGWDLSKGWSHEALGFAMFLVALGLTLSTDRWLHFAAHVLQWLTRSTRATLSPSRGVEHRPSVTVAQRHHSRLCEAEQRRAMTRRPSRAIGLAAMTAYSLLFVANVSGLSPSGRTSWKQSSVASLTSTFMPASVGDMERSDFEQIERSFSSDFGRTSLVWTYGHQDIGAIRVSIDGSFSGWHELTRCYEGHGWRLDERRVVGTGDVSWVEAMLSKPTGERACLMFSLASLDGHPLTPPAAQGASRFVDRLRDKQALQVQAFAECGGPVDEGLRVRVAQLFQAAFQRCIVGERRERPSGKPTGKTDG